MYFYFIFFKTYVSPQRSPSCSHTQYTSNTHQLQVMCLRSKNKQKAEPFGTYDQGGKSPVSMPFKMDNMQTEHVECVTSKMYRLSWHAWLTQPRVWALMSDTVHSYLCRTLTPKCCTIRDTQHFLPTFLFFFLFFFFLTLSYPIPCHQAYPFLTFL